MQGVWEGDGRACEHQQDAEDGSDGCGSKGAASSVILTSCSLRVGDPLRSADPFDRPAGQACVSTEA